MTKISHPAIPFNFTVPTAHVQVGQKFVIKGESYPQANRFCVNLVYNVTQHCIFHLDFRFDQGHTVRNSNFPYGSWGIEERSPIPLQRGGMFKLEIKVHYDRISIDINGYHHCDFRHRAPNAIGNTVQIQGEVFIHEVKIK